jgi:hypothetical protein
MQVPTAAERQDQALEFDVLQHHVKALDLLLQNMADIDDMIDELDDAAKKAGKADDWQAAACRRARAYKALQPILTAAMQKHGQLEEQLADFLKASPKLARDLACWQAEAYPPADPHTRPAAANCPRNTLLSRRQQSLTRRCQANTIEMKSLQRSANAQKPPDTLQPPPKLRRSSGGGRPHAA